ncbi:MAG TPA: TetR/AcrR family transcriptional regulator [Mariprofundaceae bacterium]|nr:TetR/AcrR family transcriptional regulator [Mariprofundaceae bacterium]
MANPGNDTRERLINTAARLLWEQSYQGTSVDVLCNRTDIRKGSFYHFFKSKTELAIAAIENSWERTEQTVFAPIFGSADPGIAQLQQLIDKVDEIQSSILKNRGLYPGCPFGSLGQEMANKDEAIRASTLKIFQYHCDYIEGALRKAEADGEIPPGNTRQRSRNIFALFEGALLTAKVARDPALFRHVAASVRAVAAA